MTYSSIEDTADNGAGDDNYLYSKGHAWYAFFLVFVLQLFDFVDRQVVSALLPAIKAEWALSDTQLGMIVGIVNVSIALLVFPTSILVDRWSRTRSIGIMSTAWSLASMACGLATGFLPLLLARFFVGAGEAGYGAAASNLLAKSFPKRMRATILGLKESGALIGSVLGVVLGGIIAAKWGWRTAFGAVAIPGFVFAILIFFLRDYQNVPAPTQIQGASTGRALTWKQTAKLILKSPSLRFMTFGTATVQLFASTIGNWMPSYFNRVYSLAPDKAGLRTGIFLLVASLGIIFFGYVGDRVGREKPHRYLYLMSGLSLISGVTFVTAYSLPAGGAQLATIYVGAFFMLGILGPAFTTIQSLVHPGLWGMAIGMYILVNNLIGMALGPVLGGMLADKYDLTTAMLIISFVPLFSCVMYYLSAGRYDESSVGG